MNHDNSMTSFVDLMAILLMAFMMITVLMAFQIAQKESLHQIDLVKNQKQQAGGGAQPGETDLFVSLVKSGTIIIQGGHSSRERKVTGLSRFVAVLQRCHPAKVYLRVDNLVPTGTTEKLLLACQNLGILTYFVSSSENSGG